MKSLTPVTADNQRKQKRRKTAQERSAMKALVPSYLVEGGLGYAARALPGGRNSLIELARLSSHEGVKKVIQAWDELTPRKRKLTRLEVLCDSIGILPADFLGAIVSAAFEHNTDVSKLILAVNTPRIMQRAVKEAATRTGFKDRQMVLEAAGVVPAKGGGIHVHAEAKAGAQAAAVVPDQTRGLPSFEEDTMLTTRVIRGGE